MTEGSLARARNHLESLRARHPMASLIGAPTPLQYLPRFSDALGTQVWIKRDDIASFGIAGSKARKLELVVAHAKTAGFDSLLTIGPRQSNTCRAVAAACAASGLRAHLLLAADEPAQLTGNALLAHLMGASIHWTGPLEMRMLHDALGRHADTLRAAGHHPLVVAPGCSDTLGIVGMAMGYVEMHCQALEAGMLPRSIFHASATGGVWAGLKLGSTLTSGAAPTAVLVLDDLYADAVAKYVELYARASEHLGEGGEPGADEVDLDCSMLEVGYGRASAQIIEAIKLIARTEGIVCEPHYSGKALAALISRSRCGDLRGPAVFWHTGGVQVLGDPEITAMLSVGN
jgi:1-aminocyclopropane-1-carboxylate deaminase/D-cysteine desulfhydrase-like pyridoxal-dependent ACC family enzyme